MAGNFFYSLNERLNHFSDTNKWLVTWMLGVSLRKVEEWTDGEISDGQQWTDAVDEFCTPNLSIFGSSAKGMKVFLNSMEDCSFRTFLATLHPQCLHIYCLQHRRQDKQQFFIVGRHTRATSLYLLFLSSHHINLRIEKSWGTWVA